MMISNSRRNRNIPEGDRVVVTLTNVTKFKHRVEIPLKEMNGYKGHWQDLLSEKEFSPKKEKLSIPLQPYDVLWLVPHT